MISTTTATGVVMRAICCLLALTTFTAVSAADEPRPVPEAPWAFTVYGGAHVDDRFLRIISLRSHSGARSSYLLAAALSRRVGRIGESLRFEVEGQLARHAGDQRHWESNAAIVARWTRFPWDHYVDTSIAIGEGLSYASRRPPLERVNDGNPRLLNYLMAEVEFGPPVDPRWRMLVRVHHRSPVFSLFDEASGSNFVTFGVRHRLQAR